MRGVHFTPWHQVDHDVHAPNMEHCLCQNCNHPCAHLCKTAKPKGKKGKKDVKIAHMCHFSHKPHGKLCCGGEDLLYESITSPKTSIPADPLCESHYVVERRLSEHSSCKSRCKSSKSETRERKKKKKKSGSSERRSSSLPAPSDTAARDQCDEICESQQAEGSAAGQEPGSRSGSELSVASLPSTTSPVEVFIARGALTDESDVDFDLLHSIAARTPSELSFGERGRVSGGLRSLVSCLVPSISYQKTSGGRSHRKRTRTCKPQQRRIAAAVSMEFSDNFKDHHFPGSVYSTRSNSRSRSCKYKGLSTSPEDLDTGRTSSANSRRHQHTSQRNARTDNDSNHNKINAFLIANDNFIVNSCTHDPDFLTDVEHKSPASTMTGSPESDKKSGGRESSPAADHRDSGVWSKVSTNASVLQVDLDVIAEKGMSAIWKDEEGDSLAGGRSPSCQYQGQAGGSEPCSAAGNCHSARKGRAPRPPAALCPNSPANSPVLSFASFSPTCRKRKSHKTRPAPSPPPSDTRTVLVRSLSEQRQLNVKNCLNAVPSFRSEVNLKAVPRLHQSADTTEEGDTLYISFDEDDAGQSGGVCCDCCDVRLPAAMAGERLEDEFLSPPLSPPLSLPLPPPPDHVDYFDDSGWHRDASVQVSGFPSPPSEYVHQEEDSGDEEYVETDDEEDSSADVTVNYECDDLVGHSHSLVVCTACGCHLFRGDVSGHPVSSPFCPSAGMCNNNNNHDDGSMRDVLTSQSQNRPANMLHRGMSQPTGRLVSASDCPSSCRYRNSYRRTFSLQFPVRSTIEPLHDPPASDPTGRRDEDPGTRTSDARSGEKSADQNSFSPHDVDLAAVSQNLKALLSPHRDWIRCSMCRTEVCWLAAGRAIRRPVIAFTLLLVLIAVLVVCSLI